MKYTLLSIAIIFCLKITAQNNTIDSLKLALKNAKHDTTRCNILNAMIESESDDAIWPIYNEQLRILAEKKSKTNTPNKSFYLKHLASALINNGFLAKQQGDIPKMLEYYHKSLRLYEKIKDKKGIAISLHNIGGIYNDQGDIPKALESFHKSLKILEEIKGKQGIAISLNSIGAIYHNQGDLPKALEYYHKSLKIREEIKDKQGIAYSLNNIGATYHNQGDLPKALEYYHKSLLLHEEIKGKEGKTYPLIGIARILLKKGLEKEALNFAERSLQTAKELGYPKDIQSAANTLKKIYTRQNNFKEAFVMYELEIQMRDSITNEENKKASIKTQFQYAYEKKAATDSVANAKANEIKNAQIAKQKAEIKAKRNQQYALYGGLTLVLLFAGFVYNRLKITQKQKVIIEQKERETHAQKEIIEEKHKEITDSINYAERIQRSFLATQEMLDKYLGAPSPTVIASEESGVTSSSIEENTPHPVTSNSIEENTSHPVTSSSLKNEGVSRSNNQYEILEYKPDKMPVGKHDKENEPFTLHTLQLQKGDVIYTLTDGFADQFGGKQGKKYMIKNVKELLLNIAHLPMPEQEQKLAEEFAAWKGSNEQVDDVCVIGVRV